MQRCNNWLHCNKRIALNDYLYYVFSKLAVEFQPVINIRNLCCHNWLVSNVVMSLLHVSISTSFPLPDRSRQLFGPCWFSSAFQHALVLVINIGEYRFFCQFSCRLSVHVVFDSGVSGSWAAAWIFYFFSPAITMLTDHHSSQGPDFRCSLPAAAGSSDQVPTTSLTLTEENGYRNWPTRRYFIQQHRD